MKTARRAAKVPAGVDVGADRPDSIRDFEPDMDPGLPTGRVYNSARLKDALWSTLILMPDQALAKYQHPKSTKCYYCGIFFRNIKIRTSHQKICPVKPSTRQCFYCRASFTGKDLDRTRQLSLWQRHQQHCHRKPARRTCKFCNKLFATYQDLENHYVDCAKIPLPLREVLLEDQASLPLHEVSPANCVETTNKDVGNCIKKEVKRIKKEVNCFKKEVTSSASSNNQSQLHQHNPIHTPFPSSMDPKQPKGQQAS